MTTPKEQAIAIINKFAALDDGEFVNDVFKDRHIEFALISINETIKQCSEYRDLDQSKSFDHWQQVRQEAIRLKKN